MALAAGEEGSKLLHNSVDPFTMGLAELWLTFTERRAALDGLGAMSRVFVHVLVGVWP